MIITTLNWQKLTSIPRESDKQQKFRWQLPALSFLARLTICLSNHTGIYNDAKQVQVSQSVTLAFTPQKVQDALGSVIKPAVCHVSS